MTSDPSSSSPAPATPERPTPESIECKHTSWKNKYVTTSYRDAFLELSKVYRPLAAESAALRQECKTATERAIALRTELEVAKKTLEAYRVRARKLYTPEVAALNLPEEEERMRNVDARLAIAEGVLKYFGLKIEDRLEEGLLLLTTDDQRCAYVRIVDGGKTAALRAEVATLKEALKEAKKYWLVTIKDGDGTVARELHEDSMGAQHVQELEENGGATAIIDEVVVLSASKAARLTGAQGGTSNG